MRQFTSTTVMDKIIGAIILTIVFVTGGVILSARVPEKAIDSRENTLSREEINNATITTKLVPIETNPIQIEVTPVTDTGSMEKPATKESTMPIETAKEPVAETPPAPSISVISYTDNGFSPTTLTIKQNDSVLFVNRSASPMWVASNVHPAHTEYPEFDQKISVANGESFQFAFTKKGSWKYHNHVNPGKTGTITVQ